MPTVATANHQLLSASRKRRKLILHLSTTKTNVQIAKLLGITKQRVGQILNEARRDTA